MRVVILLPEPTTCLLFPAFLQPEICGGDSRWSCGRFPKAAKPPSRSTNTSWELPALDKVPAKLCADYWTVGLVFFRPVDFATATLERCMTAAAAVQRTEVLSSDIADVTPSR